MFLAKYDDKIINIPYRNVYQRTWKLVDCKIYNSSTRGKSIQNQSTTPFGRCGLTLDWFTTREIVIDFAIHQLSGPLISAISTNYGILPWKFMVAISISYKLLQYIGVSIIWFVNLLPIFSNEFQMNSYTSAII